MVLIKMIATMVMMRWSGVIMRCLPADYAALRFFSAQITFS